MSRSRLWRVLEEADLKPHRERLTGSTATIQTLPSRHTISVSSMSMRFASTSRGASSSAPTKKQGMQILQRASPTQPVQPGKPAKREYESIRHGVRALLASFVVPNGTPRVASRPDPHQCRLGSPSGRRCASTADDAALRLGGRQSRYPTEPGGVPSRGPTGCAVPYVPQALHRGVQRRAFLSDPTHQHVFHFTPTHGSWLNQVELWLSVLGRRFLKRGDFDSAQDFETRLCDSLEGYNTHHAHPYRWTYTGQPLVRAPTFATPVASNVRGGRGLALGRNDLNGLSIHPDLISAPVHYW